MKIRNVVTGTFRVAAFSFLSLIRPLIFLVLEGIAFLCLFGFIACALFGQWFVFTVLLSTGLVSKVLAMGYDALLTWLTPFNYGMVSDN